MLPASEVSLESALTSNLQSLSWQFVILSVAWNLEAAPRRKKQILSWHFGM